MLEEFANSHELGEPSNVNECSAENLSITGDFALEGEFVRVWYLTNERDVVLATYMTQEPYSQPVVDELQECAMIIKSLHFQ